MSCGGGHLGFPIGIKNSNLVKDISMIIHLQFGFSQFISFREEDLWNFSQSQHIIGPVVSEKKLEMWKVYRRPTTDDGRQVMDLWSRWTKNTDRIWKRIEKNLKCFRAFQRILNDQPSQIWTYYIWELRLYVTGLRKKLIKSLFG
jgi:hypothetical protein